MISPLLFRKCDVIGCASRQRRRAFHYQNFSSPIPIAPKSISNFFRLDISRDVRRQSVQTRNFLLAGIAAVAFAGSVGLALASPAFHRMTVQLPDGGVAQIQYNGDVAPRVTYETNPFMAMDRISDEMDREMDALMDAADFSPMPLWAPMQRFSVGLRDDVPGAMQYAVVSTALGNGTGCMQTMSVTRSGDGQPKVVSHSYGNCGAVAAHPALSHAPYELRGDPQRGTIEARAPGGRETPSSLVEAAYRPVN